MPTRYETLLLRAYKYTPEIYFTELPVGVEICWRRMSTDHLGLMMVRSAATDVAALELLLEEETEYQRLKEHGENCSCVDCCIQRIDRDRLC